jgi:hypothetical protein
VSKAKDAARPAVPPEVIPPKQSRAKAALSKLGLTSATEAQHDPEMEALLAEIEADLREQELRKLWERYGKTVIAAVVVAIAVVVGVQLWRQHQTEQRLQLAAHYEQAEAAVDAGKTDDALAFFTDVARNKDEGLGSLAELDRAAILLNRHDLNGAIAAYRAVAENPKADPALRDLAVVLEVTNSIDTSDPKTLEPLLIPLADPGNPFHASATELQGLLAAKEGNPARAAKLMDQLLADPATPQAMRARAEDLANYYKSLAAPFSAPAATPKPGQP